ncbi:hypothetical protein ACF1CG_12185 [Streptomyces sp. NPDC014773]|uniref:hypothetical protein n=1 Tax=Streptomyces sp. NPDC014773 TaxID=3364908 RepID=UPI0036F83AED
MQGVRTNGDPPPRGQPALSTPLPPAVIDASDIPAPRPRGSPAHSPARTATIATLYRLLHHCAVISVNGSGYRLPATGYRLKNRLAAIARDTQVA